MAQYASAEYRQNTSFVALVLSICCLSSRYVQDPRLTFVDKDGTVLAAKLLALAAEVVQSAASQRADLWVVQALFNMAVVQEGTSKPSLLWVYLGQALTWVHLFTSWKCLTWIAPPWNWDCTDGSMLGAPSQ